MLLSGLELLLVYNNPYVTPFLSRSPPIVRIFETDTYCTGLLDFQNPKIIQNAIDIMQLLMIAHAVRNFVTSRLFLVFDRDVLISRRFSNLK